jgi:endoglycosylceramidase
VLGYDVLNEPWPGTQIATCLNPAGCPVFDQTALQPLYEKVLKAVRAVDRDRILWVEPHAIFNDGAQTSLTSFGDPEVGLSFHHYCTSATFTHSSGGTATPECPAQGELVFDNADSVITQNGWTSLLTEFGASDDLTDAQNLMTLTDEHLVGWQYWHYKEWADPTTESQTSGGQGLFTDDADLTSLKQAKADILIRPFARAVAGVPTAMSFADGVFTLRWTARRGVTEVVLPHRHFPRGYVVSVSGARVVSRPGVTVLLLRTAGSGPATVTVARRA